MITLDFGKYESSTWSRVSQKNEGEVKKLTAKTVSLLSSLFGNKTHTQQIFKSGKKAIQGLQKDKGIVHTLQHFNVHYIG